MTRRHPVHPALLALLLALAACATAPPRAPEEPPPANPLARAAWEEWTAWGRLTVDGFTDASPADTAATPERFDRLVGYWDALPGGWPVAARHRQLRQVMQPGAVYTMAPRYEDIDYYGSPAWSAAFISAVARRAGIPEGDLPSASRHARYVDAALLRWRAAPEAATFQPHAPEDHAPAVGDLLCADRAPSPLVHWTQRYASINRPRPLHCDVVVATAPGRVDVIGGNVMAMVTRRRLPADAQGRVLPAPDGYPPVFLVLAARDVTPVAPPTAP
ncbi:DUF2272 domain-containing protein [Falsiroseomonas sp. HW251]|uniref:DUF2272 domain-containing protein n=1 Tax=Falsiroseomonas sp. HW251 TaxID=3390998 RepID=UPI003D311817